MSMQTETRHIQTSKPGVRQEKEITTTTTVEPGKPGNKSYAEAAGGASPSSRSRRSSFSQQAQQLLPHVSKQQLSYILPAGLALLLGLLFLGLRHTSYLAPTPPPTRLEKFSNKLDSYAHNIGGDYWEALKHKTSSLSESASEITDSLLSIKLPGMDKLPGLDQLKQKADDLKAEADKQYKLAAEYAEKAKEQTKAQANKAAGKAAGAAGIKVDNLKENSADAYNRASLNSASMAESVRHAVNEATESVRHTVAEQQEGLRHKAAMAGNYAQQKVQDVKEKYHDVKQTIKEHL